jgi:GDP-L-fucose synthase
MKKKYKVLITGSQGLLGSACCKLMRHEYQVLAPTKKELNLNNLINLVKYFKKNKPHFVINCAAKVGGILANMNNQVEFVNENIIIQNNIFQLCKNFKVKKLVFIGSTCIYPKNSKLPIKESSLLEGQLESSNEGYALTKILGLKLAKFYYKEYGLKTVCPMLCNIYGTNDYFDYKKSHVLSALIKKIVDAKKNKKERLKMIGTGKAIREFMHVEDAARGIKFFLEKVDTYEHINLGSGEFISIKDLVKIIKKIENYKGKIIWEKSTKMDGMPAKYSDISRIKKFGFKHTIPLKVGIKRTIEEYKKLRRIHY